MGWIRGRGSRTATDKLSSSSDLKSDIPKGVSEHFESVESDQVLHSVREQYPFVSLSTTDAELPFIPGVDVRKRKSEADGTLWIVIDNIVYDCTDFLPEHPGGEAVIKSFGGAECSWQFWRFHGAKELEDFGRPLRIGRTEGMVNRYKEPIKYVGMKCRSLDEW